MIKLSVVEMRVIKLVWGKFGMQRRDRGELNWGIEKPLQDGRRICRKRYKMADSHLGHLSEAVLGIILGRQRHPLNCLQGSLEKQHQGAGIYRMQQAHHCCKSAHQADICDPQLFGWAEAGKQHSPLSVEIDFPCN